MWGEEQERVALSVSRYGKRPLPASWRKEHGAKDRRGARAFAAGCDKGRSVHEGGESGAGAVSGVITELSGSIEGDLRQRLMRVRAYIHGQLSRFMGYLFKFFLGRAMRAGNLRHFRRNARPAQEQGDVRLC